MMEWIYKLNDPLWQTLAASTLVFFAIIILTRIVGLRSFAKFTAYDFAFTVAIGSSVAAILTSSTTVVHGAVAISSLLLLTYIFSSLERKFDIIKKLLSNKPLLLMEKDKILTNNLKHARIHKDQLLAKLREANVLDFNEVEAVVLESTGDISVLHKSNPTSTNELNSVLLEGVRKVP